MDLQPPAHLTAFHRMAWGPSIDLRNRSFMQDPYPYYAWLRGHDPVHRDRYGSWVISRYKDIRLLLQSQKLDVEGYYQFASSSSLNSLETRGCDPSPLSAISNILLFIDNPRHERLRGMINSAWRKQKLGSRNDDLERIVSETLELLAHRSSFDAVHDFALRVPSRLACLLLGIPENSSEFLALNSQILTLFDQLASPKKLIEVNNQLRRVIEFFQPLINERRKYPRADLMTTLITECDGAGNAMSNEEILATCIMLAMAGIHTFAPIFSNSVINIIDQQVETLSLTPRSPNLSLAVDELLRHDPSVQTVVRVANQDIQIGSKTISKGDIVNLCLGSANRDEEVFDDPDRIDLGRRPTSPHLSFGSGAHVCLGAGITKMMMPIALSRIAPLLENAKLLEPIHYRSDAGFRIPDRVIVGLAGDD